MVTQESSVKYDLQVFNGKSLWLPPWEAGNDAWGNLAPPDVYAVGTRQLYPTGTIYRHGIRTFAYTKWSSDTDVVGAGYCAESTAELFTRSNSLITGNSGAFTVIVNMGAAVAVNAYAGGFIGIKMATGGLTTVGRYSTFQIISHTVSDGNNRCTFTLDGPLVLDLTTNDDFVIAEHPYAEVRMPGTANYSMCVGITISTVVVSNYCWLQTGGPHNMLSAIATFEGGDPNSVPVYSIAGVPQVSEGGAAGDATPNGIAAASLQCIGHVYASTDIGGPGGTPADFAIAPTVWLNILQ